MGVLVEARHLRYALALAEQQHFGRAARVLGMAQPPLSRQIALLEKEVGARLFDRTARGVFPTAAGEAFLARARRALAELGAAAVDAGRADRGETGRLRLGFVASALLEPLPGVLGPFGRRHADVRLELRETASAQGVAELVAGELDVVFGLGRPRGRGVGDLVSVVVGRDALVAVVGAGHPWAGVASVGLEQLRRQRLIVSPGSEEPAVGAWLRGLLGEEALAGAVQARDVHTIIGMAACGIGVGLGPERMRVAERAGVWFCAVEPVVELPELVLSFRAGDDSPVLAAFLAVVRERCPGVAARLAEVGAR
ncbi:LysR family transcriptional regulator [Actinosynnema mirum]|uniref:Transcriptional regulator, LysR family n=1 Tax=Actinosynnema mirum (strain ATCC 29888 / DSM 43827 / JCM 3225 / NBRC 14064 / NCIMB 13271 / NRRL B-12336 / IMRU 3971 / 101) TaxID=446462 RepID=C6WQS6_ACTMD|nr:LysR family transcriptional regulator [Actinosynnema mirum]ACU38766.1 transcriptional regulator, LysR family [Actinosynnema mirum DSM 43827]